MGCLCSTITHLARRALSRRVVQKQINKTFDTILAEKKKKKKKLRVVSFLPKDSTQIKHAPT